MDPARGIDVDSDQERGARLARFIGARAIVHRADELGQPFSDDVLALARQILRDEEARTQKPIGSPA
jgi:hypothetical protein